MFTLNAKGFKDRTTPIVAPVERPNTLEARVAVATNRGASGSTAVMNDVGADELRDRA